MEGSIISLILFEYSNLTKSEKKIADYVLEHQFETQYISITDLSIACGVAVSTVSVFCRKLKLSGFNDFKLELAKASIITDSQNMAPLPELVNYDNPIEAVLEKVLHVSQDALNLTYRMVDAPMVQLASDLIDQARQVVILGQGNHSIVASIAWAQFSAISSKFKTVEDSHLQLYTLSTLSPEDVVLYFSYTGATRELLEAVELISAVGAKLILVTHYSNAPACASADAVLLCGINEAPLSFGSIAIIISQLYIINLLVDVYNGRHIAQSKTYRDILGKAINRRVI